MASVIEGDLIEVRHEHAEQFTYVGDGIPVNTTVLAKDRDNVGVDVKSGTRGIAFRFESLSGSERYWWVFLDTGKKVRVPARNVRSLAHAGSPV